MRILSTLDREVLKPNTSVALHRHSHSVVEILPPESDSTIQLMQERPDVTYHDIGGMDMQKQEVIMGVFVVCVCVCACFVFSKHVLRPAAPGFGIVPLFAGSLLSAALCCET